MSIDATASALAADTAAPELPMTDLPNDEADLSALYDKLNEELPAEDAPTEQPETEEAAPEAVVEEPAADDEKQAESVEVPSGLPAELKDQWAKMPAEARDAVLKDREGLHRKLSEMGRQVQGISPIRDALVQAVEKFPSLANMKPQDVAQQVFQLADIGQKLRDNPGQVLAQLAKRHGAEKALLQSLQGQNVTQDARQVTTLQNEIQALKQQIARMADPEYLQQTITQVTSQQQVATSVQEFAEQSEHWATVEDHMPAYIQVAKAKLGEGAAPQAVLELAYTKAVEDFVGTKALPAPAAEAPSAPDPEKTAKALAAKSVNVSSKPTGKSRPLTEEEELALVYDKASKR